MKLKSMTAAGQRSGGVNNIHVHVSLCSLARLKDVVRKFLLESCFGNLTYSNVLTMEEFGKRKTMQKS